LQSLRRFYDWPLLRDSSHEASACRSEFTLSPVDRVFENRTPNAF